MNFHLYVKKILNYFHARFYMPNLKNSYSETLHMLVDFHLGAHCSIALLFFFPEPSTGETLEKTSSLFSTLSYIEQFAAACVGKGCEETGLGLYLLCFSSVLCTLV